MKKYYFLGIGGVSMSALAIMLKEKGFFVRGSDETDGQGTALLNKFGIVVDFCVNEEEISKADVVVRSSAIKDEDEHLLCARKYKKKIISRGQLLGQIAGEYEKVVAVAGSHGKTTTTAMIENILRYAGRKPTLHLGGYKISDGKNFEFGEKEFFVTEACEYHNNFLHLHPYIGVVTNVEKEHMDFFKTFSNERKSFEKFKQNSAIVVDNFEGLSAKNVRHDKNGGLVFNLMRGNIKIMHLNLRICEEVNKENCIYAYLVAKKLGIDDCLIKGGLENFMGTHTRFEKVNCKFFDTVFCDYAHHPTEIDKAIKSAKKIFRNRELVTIFQPHTYSRTQSLLFEFVSVFKQVKHPLFYRTYSARENESQGMSSKQLSDIVHAHNENAKYFDNFEDLKAYLLSLKGQRPVLLFLGAGDLPAVLHKKQFIT